MSRVKFEVPILLLVTVSAFAVGQVLSMGPSIPFKPMMVNPWIDLQQTSQNLVINDNTTWLRVWNASFCTATFCYPGLSAPPVDFSNTTVLAIIVGDHNYHDLIRITRISLTSLGLIVDVNVTAPGRNCVFFGPLIPYGAGGQAYFVTIRKTTSHVTFEVRTTTYTCRSLTWTPNRIAS